jgi:arginase
VETLPEALLDAGLAERLGAERFGRIEPPPYDPRRDPATKLLNPQGIADYSRALADAVACVRGEGKFPIVLGGDCSIVLGALLALRRRGRYGLAFIDGHDDYSWAKDYDRYAGLFAAAGLDLGLVTGHGPDALCDIDGLRPYVRETDIVHLGLQRDPEDLEFFDVAKFDDSAITRFTAAEIRSGDASRIAAQARDHLETVRAVPGFWIHLDADVLHSDVMPAVDSPNPNGISFAELEAILGTLLASPRATGMHVSIYDPELDPERTVAKALADALIGAFERAGI